MKPAFSGRDKTAVLDAFRASASMTEAVRKLNCNEATMRRTLKRWGVDYRTLIAGGSVVPEAIDWKVEAEKLRIERDALRGNVEELERQHHEEEAMREQLRDFQVPKWLFTPRPGAPERSVPVALWTDWHTRETVNPEIIGGLNAYNKEIQEERVKTLVSGTLDLLKHHVAEPAYPGMIIALCGDMDGGDIHEELTATNWGEPVDGVRVCAGLLCSAIEVLAENLGNIYVPCVGGNHTRMTKKMTFKRRVGTSLDTMIYERVAEHFVRDKNVTIDIAQGPHAMWSVYGHRYLQTHLDPFCTGVKGGDGIIGPAGPIIRGGKKLGARAQKIGQPFDTMVGGHWHTRFNLGSQIVTGDSLKGFDEMANACGFDFEPPSQELWLHHPQRGMTVRWPVMVGGKSAKPKSKHWVGVFR